MKSILLVRALLILVSLVFLASFYWAGSTHNLIESLKFIMTDPWGAVTMMDLYTGLFCTTALIYFLEKSIPVTLFWFVLLLGLGNFTTVVYLLVRSFRVADTGHLFLPVAFHHVNTTKAGA